MAQHNETQIIAEPGKQEVFIIREFNAPRVLVFRAHTEPELFAQWIGPKDMGITIECMEARAGGRYRYINSNSKGYQFVFNGVFHEVTAPERIIQTFEFEGLPEPGHVVLSTLTLEALPGNRTKLVSHSVFQSVGDRDQMVASGMEHGVNEGYEKLDAVCAGL